MSDPKGKQRGPTVATWKLVALLFLFQDVSYLLPVASYLVKSPLMLVAAHKHVVSEKFSGVAATFQLLFIPFLRRLV